MPEAFPFLNTLVACVVMAFAFGYLASWLRLPVILGYLLAGIALSPNSPGYAADIKIAHELAEIGVILLMFGVGLHFSVGDLLRVGRVAVPGALVQMLAATLLGGCLMWALGTPPLEAFIFGFSLSVASTVVLLRNLEQRKELETPAGRIATGWLIVEDIAMVIAVALLPIIAQAATSVGSVSWQALLGRAGGAILGLILFAVLMIFIGRRILPRVLSAFSHSRSAEMLVLGTLAIALGFAYLAYVVFSASFAMGAFLAGLVLSESSIGRKAKKISIPMRDTFAALFFVSVGMLFNISTLWEHFGLVIAITAVVILGKGLAALITTRLLKQPHSVGMLVAVALSQIGEFSFIFAGMARHLGLMSATHFDLILAAAVISIALNPLLFKLADRATAK
jgi:monovalent cation:H+ antiporter-2, CPA2 family